MRVAIITTFANLDRSYSLVGVVLEQCAMLKENGFDFTLFALDEDSLNDEARESLQGVDWLTPHLRMEVPNARLEQDVIDGDLAERVEEWLNEVAHEFDVFITHDLMFVDWYVSYNHAIRRVAEDHPEVTWVHWVHSAPGQRPARLQGPAALRYDAAPYSLYVYLNETDRLRYAESIGIDVGRVLVCYNPMDSANFLGCDQITSEFIRKHELHDHDLMQVYPFCMTRVGRKGVDKLIGLFGSWKMLGYRVKLVLVNAHSNASAEQAAVRSYSESAYREWGLTPADLIWTSNEDGWDYSVPNTTVKKLLQLSNIFVFPTHSEACSRVLQEASLAGCFVIGNDSFKPMFEFLHPSVPRHEFGSLREAVSYEPSQMQWLREVARATTPLLGHPMLKQKTHMLRLASRQFIWREQFLPILEKAHAMAGVRT